MKMRCGAALAALGILLLAGCGGGNGGSNAVLPPGNRDGDSRMYSITDLGASAYYYGYYYGRYYYGYYPIYGLSRGAVVSTNNHGQVVTDTTYTAAVWQNGVLTQLDDGYSNASALNDLGQIVGGAYNADAQQWQAVRWVQGQRSFLSTLPGGYYSRALGINAEGDIVGESSMADGPNNGYPWHGFLWHDNKMTDLGVLHGGYYSRAAAVNANLQVVGWSNTSLTDYRTHAFRWENGTMTDLGVLPGGTTSDASAINDQGQIVGTSDSPPQGLYGFRAIRGVLWRGSGMLDLGTLGGPGSIAFDINNLGQIVGSAETDVIDNTIPTWFYGYGGGVGGGTTGGAGGGTGGSTGGGTGNGGGTGVSLPGGVTPGAGNPIGGGAGTVVSPGRAARNGKTRGIGDTYVAHAFLYQNGKMEDLNSHIAAGSGWELIQATGISEDGKIVGFGMINKRVHAFLLTPQ